MIDRRSVMLGAAGASAAVGASPAMATAAPAGTPGWQSRASPVPSASVSSWPGLNWLAQASSAQDGFGYPGSP